MKPTKSTIVRRVKTYRDAALEILRKGRVRRETERLAAQHHAGDEIPYGGFSVIDSNPAPSLEKPKEIQAPTKTRKQTVRRKRA